MKLLTFYVITIVFATLASIIFQVISISNGHQSYDNYFKIGFQALAFSILGLPLMGIIGLLMLPCYLLVSIVMLIHNIYMIFNVYIIQ